MKKLFNIYVSSIISIIYIAFTVICLKDKYEFLVTFSFICVIISNFMLMNMLFSRPYSYFDAIMSCFYSLFFIIAPVLQLSKGRYPIPMGINEEYIVISNICNVVFVLIYLFFRCTNFKNKDKNNKFKIKEFKLRKITLIIMALIFFLVFIPNLPSMANSILSGVNESPLDKTSGLIINKFIMFIPLLFVFYFIIEYRKNNSKQNLFILLFWFIILIICKNPFTEKRNALGPIYLSIIFFLTIKKGKLKTFLVVAISIFVIAFPLTSIITHSDIGLLEFFNNFNKFISYDEIINQFFELHFDAYSNIGVAIEYTKNFGFSFGKQFIGAFLFFVPRSIWSGKPMNSGIITGNYLMSYYGLHFNNLSSPITAEAYFNGGIIAVIIFSIIMAIWSKLVYKWLSYRTYYSLISWYMVIHLFFLMRGDLMNGIAYLIGPLAAVYFVPFGIEKVLDFFTRKKFIEKLELSNTTTV